ncbi:hypothetical protein MA16_Dca009909 [Dendrobium catenatum]|uniref:Uncharacterized protein n=1 Tax=Dendrobium catenatum TaxID=906689 RepID=A0A2I0VKJ7_9ASPA|nr:hypothetical protein MA16_Dca009909 [Dendrobium catenatum]
MKEYGYENRSAPNEMRGYVGKISVYLNLIVSLAFVHQTMNGVNSSFGGRRKLRTGQCLGPSVVLSPLQALSVRVGRSEHRAKPPKRIVVGSLGGDSSGAPSTSSPQSG